MSKVKPGQGGKDWAEFDTSTAPSSSTGYVIVYDSSDGTYKKVAVSVIDATAERST
jgi:hypothetical protein